MTPAGSAPKTSPTHESGYVIDVPYPRSFTRDLAPPTLRLVAALNGVAPPAEDEFDYCDLGCASGDTLTTLAAANPKARFVGVELNPRHVAVARARAARGKLTNVRVVEADFSSLARPLPGEAPLPVFDFIVAHGIWSWVSVEKREAILAFVRTHLRPGGLFAVSYNALPGWAPALPIRRLLVEHAPARPGVSTLERAEQGLKFLRRLESSGAEYVRTQPTVRGMLALMQKGGAAYVAHEYLHEAWEPMYFADVARTMAAHGLGFLGRTPLPNNLRELAVPPSIKTLADNFPDRVALEGLIDLATNELFRSDVYVQGKVVRAVDEARLYFEGTPFGTMTSLGQVKREVTLPSYTLEYKDPIYEAILAVVSERATTGMELAMRPDLAVAGQLRVGDHLQNLAVGGQVVPMRRAATTEDDRGGADEPTDGPLSAYNRLVVDEALAEEGPMVLASPVTGSGVQISLLDALSLHLMTSPDLGVADARAREASVRGYAARRAMPLVVGERKVKDADELVRIMSKEVERFAAGPLKKLKELGVVR